MSRTAVVCLAGVSGAGKDTAGRHLRRRHGFQRVSIADPLKEAVAELFGMSRRQLWGHMRDTRDPRLGKTPRELYQWFGRACVEVDPEVWIRPFRARVREILSSGGQVVCTDLRTHDELQIVRSLGGSVWLIEREGAGAPGVAAMHTTETEVARAPHERFDRVIRNDYSVAELHANLDRALAESV